MSLAARLGAPVITSQTGKGVIPEDHRFSLGNLWRPGNPVDGMLRGASLAIIVGTKLGAAETEVGMMRRTALR